MTTPNFRPGQFVWRDLFTTDVAKSQQFYSEVFGWKPETMKLPGGEDHYTMLKAGEQMVGGMMKVPMAGMPAFWTGYVSVDDVDAAAKRVTAGGGKVLHGPSDIPNIGRYVLVQDPQGAAIHAWKSVQGDGPQRAQPGAGEFCWEQLNTTDPAAAAAFYSAVFGWTEKPMEQDKDIKVYSAGAVQVASAMKVPAPGVPAHWLSYVVVDKLTSAHARVKQQGGQAMVERIDVPGVGAIGVIQDNVGAVLGIFEMPAA